VDDFTPISKRSLIDLGDIILPGIILKYKRKCDTKMVKKRLFLFAVIGYIVGISLCMFFLLMFNTA